MNSNNIAIIMLCGINIFCFLQIFFALNKYISWQVVWYRDTMKLMDSGSLHQLHVGHTHKLSIGQSIVMMIMIHDDNDSDDDDDDDYRPVDCQGLGNLQMCRH